MGRLVPEDKDRARQFDDISLNYGETIRGYRFNDYSFFLADDWKVTSSLTLNLGVRYEYFGSPWEINGILNNFDFDRALGLFQRAQALRPEHSWAYAGLGMALNAKGDHPSAVEPLRKAVEIDPNSVSAQFELGQASFKLGDSDQALECFRRVVELNPKFNPMAYKIMSSIYINKQDATGAASQLKSYLNEFPDAPDRDKVERILE